MATEQGGRQTSLILSILADLPSHQARTVAAQRGLEEGVSWLGRQLRQAGLRASWFSREPAVSVQRKLASVAAAQDELGLLADEDWSSARTSRARLAAELTRRLLSARSAGLKVTSLAMPTREIPHADLLHKHAIRTVACFSSEGSRWHKQRMRSPFFDLWQAPIEVMLPHSGLRRLRLEARQWLYSRAGSEAAIHAGIDLHLLCQEGAGSRRSLSRWLAAVARLRDQKRCRVTPLGEAIAEITQPRQTASSRSILRAA